MSVALVVVFSSLVTFIVYAVLCAREARTGHRLLLTNFRNALDQGLVDGAAYIERKATYVSRYVITLSWYYSLHAFLKVVLRFIAGVYNIVESILHHNRTKARVIRTERKRATESHLTKLANHKEDTKLTESQKQKRRDKALLGK